MKRLLIFAALAIAVFSLTYGGPNNNTGVPSQSNMSGSIRSGERQNVSEVYLENGAPAAVDAKENKQGASVSKKDLLPTKNK